MTQTDLFVTRTRTDAIKLRSILGDDSKVLYSAQTEYLSTVTPRRIFVMPGVDLEARAYAKLGSLRQLLQSRQLTWGAEAEFHVLGDVIA